VVEEGPVEWIGAEVWGTGGDTGFTRDRTHTRQELERQDNLLRGGIAGTRQRLEQATAAHDTASAALAAAEATIESSAAFAMPPP
jgi:multidrug resistance efflux pump